VTQATKAPSSMTSNSSNLSQDAFKSGIKVLMAEYSWKADESQLRQWYRVLGWLSDEAWLNAIDNWILSDSTFRPKPGQLVVMARQMTMREKAERDAKASREAQETLSEARCDETVAQQHRQVMEREKRVSGEVRRAILGRYNATYRNPDAVRLVMETIGLLTMQEPLCNRADPIADALASAEKINDARPYGTINP